MTTTQWFILKDKPVHIGWYECRYIRPYWPGEENVMYTKPCFRYWNGTRWAMTEKNEITSFGLKPLDQWRGLADKPTKKKS